MILLTALLLSVSATLTVAPTNPTPKRISLQAPAGREYARVVPGGVTILPNGRFLTPKGARLYTGEDLWQVILSPNGKTLAAFHNGGLSIWRDVTITVAGRVGSNPEQKTFSRKNLAPAGAFTLDGARLVISLGEEGAIELLDAGSLASIAKISANIGGYKDSYINDLALSRDGKLAYAVDIANQRLVTFDLANRTVKYSAKAGRQPYALVVSEDGRNLFVANIGLFDYSLVPAPRPGEGSPKGISRPAFAFPSSESESGVEFEGRRVPGLGSPYVPDAQSIYQYALAPGAAPK